MTPPCHCRHAPRIPRLWLRVLHPQRPGCHRGAAAAPGAGAASAHPRLGRSPGGKVGGGGKGSREEEWGLIWRRVSWGIEEPVCLWQLPDPAHFLRARRETALRTSSAAAGTGSHGACMPSATFRPASRAATWILRCPTALLMLSTCGELAGRLGYRLGRFAHASDTPT